jgi:CubicO group peptidase (beta-lactamase class C family)
MCVRLLFLAPFLRASLAVAQPAAAPAPTIPAPALAPTVTERIRQVENSLLPYVPVNGLTGWNLLARTQFHRVPGLSIAVVHNYQVEWARTYGWADTTARTPVTVGILFSAGSISKLVAAGAALKLVEQGRLSLDAPINTWLKSW